MDRQQQAEYEIQHFGFSQEQITEQCKNQIFIVTKQYFYKPHRTPHSYFSPILYR